MKKGGERLPDRISRLYNHTNNIDEAEVFVGDNDNNFLNVEPQTPDWSPDNSDSEDEPFDEETFEQNLYYVIDSCLQHASSVGNQAIRSLANDDGLFDESLNNEDNILRLNDEQLEKAAANACNELVYGDYQTGHIGFLQQARDMRTISRVSQPMKNTIYDGVKNKVNLWFSEQQETLTHLEMNEDDSKIVKFYTHVKDKIITYVEVAFGIPPGGRRLRIINGGRGKKKKTTRKKKGSGNQLTTPLRDCSDSSDSSEFITPNNSSSDLIPVSLKMDRTPPRRNVKRLQEVFEDALNEKIIKEQKERSKNINEYMNKIKEGEEEYRKDKKKGKYHLSPSLTFGGKKTRKRKHKKTKKRKPKKKTRRRK
jgi:hypothetical protein